MSARRSGIEIPPDWHVAGQRSGIEIPPDWHAARQQWAAVARTLRSVPHGHSVDVPAGIAHPARAGARRSFGLPVGQLGDWRFPPRPDGSGIHVHDMGAGGWRAHVDAIHPDVDLLEHIKRDVFHVSGVPYVPTGNPAAGIQANADGSYGFGGASVDSPLPPEAAPIVGAASSGGVSPADLENDMGIAMGALAPLTGGVTGVFWTAWLGIQALLIKVYGTAGEGPGGCVDGSSVDFSWEHWEGPYTAPAPGSFEEFAYALILADWSNIARCPADPNAPDAVWWSAAVSEMRMPAVLQLAIAAWNATHSSAGSAQTSGPPWNFPILGSGGTRQISSVVLNAGVPGGFAGGGPEAYDPIDVALNAAAWTANQAAGLEAGDPTSYGVVSTTRAVAPGSVVSFTVNNGPALPDVMLSPDPSSGYAPGQVFSIVLTLPGASLGEGGVTGTGIAPSSGGLGPYTYLGGGASLAVDWFPSADAAHNGEDQTATLTIDDAPGSGPPVKTTGPGSGGGGSGGGVIVAAGLGLGLLALLARR